MYVRNYIRCNENLNFAFVMFVLEYVPKRETYKRGNPKSIIGLNKALDDEMDIT